MEKKIPHIYLKYYDFLFTCKNFDGLLKNNRTINIQLFDINIIIYAKNDSIEGDQDIDDIFHSIMVGFSEYTGMYGTGGCIYFRWSILSSIPAHFPLQK